MTATAAGGETAAVTVEGESAVLVGVGTCGGGGEAGVRGSPFSPSVESVPSVLSAMVGSIAVAVAVAFAFAEDRD